jgi:carbamoyltransferase
MKKKLSDIYVLGINEGLTASAALLKNGQIIVAASEERFTRVKNESGYPKCAIDFCLNFAQINSHDLNCVMLSYVDPYVHFTSGRMEERKSFAPGWLRTLRDFAPILEYKLPAVSALTEVGRKGYYYYLAQKLKLLQIKEIAQALNIPSKKIDSFNHHLAHAYTAYFSSPNYGKKTLILTCDGAGDQLSAGIWIGDKNTITAIALTSHLHSLGLFYAAITAHLGMKAHEDEYKVMGLAPYASSLVNKNLYNCFERLLWIEGMKFNSLIPSRQFGLYLREKVGNTRFDIVAATAQQFFQDSLCKWVVNAIKMTGVPNVAVSGGAFLNVKANLQLTYLKKVKHIFFMPSPGDDTNTIGAATRGYLQQNCKSFVTPIRDLYLGNDISELSIQQGLKIYNKFQVMRPTHMAQVTAKLLSQGKVIARCVGRMEFGVRALGNRSILADPRNPEVIQVINRIIKMRDFWMPFAPTILCESAHLYLKNPRKLMSPYMILAFETTERSKKDLAAALHPYDKTVRPQILTKEHNPLYYEIIKAFEKITGTAALLNTSFNIHGEPIVSSALDALSTFTRSGLTHLILGNYLISKKS